jgi:hypothetical protein
MKIKISFFIAIIALTIASLPVYATAINVDQILYKLNIKGGLTEDQAGNLSASVDMTFDEAIGLLTITLTNTSGLTTGKTASASNLLTGIGFDLPDGISIIDNMAHDSLIYLPSGSKSSKAFSQNAWGWSQSLEGGHFSEKGVLPVDVVLSSMKADGATTFGGLTNGSNKMGGTDFGLQSFWGSPGPSSEASITSSIAFKIYLSKVQTSLVSYIENHGVVVEYGSPSNATGIRNTPVSQVPEPATWILLATGFVGFIVAGRKARIR